MKYFFICLFFMVVPALTHAAVTINEVAWMGNTNSANDEWIELYNSGDQSVDVSGWSLSDGMNLSITLAGTIGAGQYAVLERTDEDSAPGTAFLLYSGSLVNSGATLSLYRTDNSLEDRVVGGGDWQNIGGDNVTKETAQYTTKGWATAVATAGMRNQEDVSIPTESAEDTQEEASGGNSGSVSVPTLNFIPRDLKLDMLVPSRVYVNQEVSMRVEPSGLADGILNGLDHQWNFGDVTTATGKEVLKRFAFPGEYVVTLHSQYKDYEAYARQTVVVLPVSFSMTKSPQGDVQVHNDARYEVDISGYKIAGGATLTFPERSILLPHATITIPKERIKFTRNATLFDDISVQVASLLPTQYVSQQKQSVAIEEIFVPELIVQDSAIPKAVSETSVGDSFSFLSETKEERDIQIVQSTTTTVQEIPQTAAAIDATPKESTNKLPYFALLAVIGLGIVTVFASRVSSDS